MEIRNNNISFTSIKLSNSKFEDVRNVVFFLKSRGIDVLGHRTFYINNNFSSQKKLFNYVRERNNFSVNKCGVIFLPWSREAHILSSHVGEQRMLNDVIKVDKGAAINLLF